MCVNVCMRVLDVDDAFGDDDGGDANFECVCLSPPSVALLACVPLVLSTGREREGQEDTCVCVCIVCGWYVLVWLVCM